jgi:hypothetical protein
MIDVHIENDTAVFIEILGSDESLVLSKTEAKYLSKLLKELL